MWIATRVTFFNNNVDLINLKLSFQNGAIADIQLHAAGSEMKSEGLFVAENGYYQVDFSNHEIVEIVHANNDQLSLMDNAALQPRLAKFSKKILVFNPVKKAFHNFYENISHGFTPLVNIDDAKKHCTRFAKGAIHYAKKLRKLGLNLPANEIPDIMHYFDYCTFM